MKTSKGFIQKSSGMNSKKSLFCYKMCHNLKKFKGYEENFPHRCRPLLSQTLYQMYWKSDQK